ncbi:hypothetical protein [Acetobacter senegalensis]|uniref:hypothetical protein n=1 Tax=Acetobacter senegalensis TaxID=446692 RepID=UPI001EDF7CEE|nr:hypothetical protein [Acetobacter senegalensis]MCG4273940.1 hypothetical protein [Acetobacter senegalensis]
MRTRDEQIQAFVEANQDSICHEDYTPDDLRMMLNAAIQESEQRVRAQIGRDSERLDWLESQPFTMLQLFDQGWTVSTDQIARSLMEETARNAIDAAREVG